MPYLIISFACFYFAIHVEVESVSHSEDESYCNPEPPAELAGTLLNADNIGETVFSKHWLFTVLMKLIQVIAVFKD